MQHERRDTIRKILDSESVVIAQELAARFGVSGETIRRDLDQLESEGLIQRVHGGAVSVRRNSSESAYQARMLAHTPEKQAIARLAAEMICDGDTVLLTPGTTTLDVAACLHGKRGLTAVTNSLPIAMELSGDPEIAVCCLGGQVRSEDYSAVGIMALENLKLYNVSKLVLGIGCITPEQGVTDYRMEDALVLQHFVECADQVIGVADSSKFGLISGFRVCPANKLDCIITDGGIPEKQRRLYGNLGVRLIIAKGGDGSGSEKGR